MGAPEALNRRCISSLDELQHKSWLGAFPFRHSSISLLPQGPYISAIWKAQKQLMPLLQLIYALQIFYTSMLPHGAAAREGRES